MESYRNLIVCENNDFNVTYTSPDKVLVATQLDQDEQKESEIMQQHNASSCASFKLRMAGYVAWHKSESDEIWHYYGGDSSVRIHVIDQNNQYKSYFLGNEQGFIPATEFQIMIKAGCWISAENVNTHINSFSCIGCTISPSPDLNSFQVAEKDKFAEEYSNFPKEVLQLFKSDAIAAKEKTLSMDREFSRHKQEEKISAEHYIKLYNLQKHVEGGYFSLKYTSGKKVTPLSERHSNKSLHNAISSIYFLLQDDNFSAFHQLNSDEIWHYYTGSSPINLYIIDDKGICTTHTLGNPLITDGTCSQVVVKAGFWFAAKVSSNKPAFGLVGCTVSPGFEYEDFKLANRAELIQKYKIHAELITKLTRVTNSEKTNIWSATYLKSAVATLISGVGQYFQKKNMPITNNDANSKKFNNS